MVGPTVSDRIDSKMDCRISGAFRRFSHSISLSERRMTVTALIFGRSVRGGLITHDNGALFWFVCALFILDVVKMRGWTKKRLKNI